MGLFSRENPTVWDSILGPFYTNFFDHQHALPIPPQLSQSPLQLPSVFSHLLQQIATRLQSQTHRDIQPSALFTLFQMLFQPTPPSTFNIATNFPTISLLHHLLWLKAFASHLSTEQLFQQLTQPILYPSPSCSTSDEELRKTPSECVSLLGSVSSTSTLMQNNDDNATLTLPHLCSQPYFLPLVHYNLNEVISIVLNPHPSSLPLQFLPTPPQAVSLFSNLHQSTQPTSTSVFHQTVSPPSQIPFEYFPQHQLDQVTSNLFNSGLCNEVLYTFRHFFQPTLHITTIQSTLFTALTTFLQCFLFTYRFSIPTLMTKLQQYIKDYSQFLIRHETNPSHFALQQCISSILPYLSPVECIYDAMQTENTAIMNHFQTQGGFIQYTYTGDNTELLVHLVHQYDQSIKSTYALLQQTHPYCFPMQQSHFTQQSGQSDQSDQSDQPHSHPFIVQPPPSLAPSPFQLQTQSPLVHKKPSYQTTLARYFGMPKSTQQYISNDTHRIANESTKQVKMRAVDQFSQFEADLHDGMADGRGNGEKNEHQHPDNIAIISPTKKQRTGQ